MIYFAPKVPAEYLGRARVLRTKLEAADTAFVAIQNGVLDDMERRLLQRGKKTPNPTLRKPDCQDWARQLREAGNHFGQQSHVSLDWSKRQVRFSLPRLVSAYGRAPVWEEYEQAVGLCVVQLFATAEKGGWTDMQGVASLSLHALGRFFQRSFQPTEASLLAAIWSLLPRVTTVLKTDDNEFALPVAGGGHWHGKVVNSWQTCEKTVDAEKVCVPALDVRTFFFGRDDWEDE